MKRRREEGDNDSGADAEEGEAALTRLMQRVAANPHDRRAWVAALIASGLSPEEAGKAATAAVAPYHAAAAAAPTPAAASPTASPTAGEDFAPPAAGDNDAAAATLAAMSAAGPYAPQQQTGQQGVSPGASSGGGVLLDDEDDIAAVAAVARLSSPQRSVQSPPAPRPGFDAAAARAGALLHMRPAPGGGGSGMPAAAAAAGPAMATGGHAQYYAHLGGAGLMGAGGPMGAGRGLLGHFFLPPPGGRPVINVIGRPWSEEEKRVLLSHVSEGWVGKGLSRLVG